MKEKPKPRGRPPKTATKDEHVQNVVDMPDGNGTISEELIADAVEKIDNRKSGHPHRNCQHCASGNTFIRTSKTQLLNGRIRCYVYWMCPDCRRPYTHLYWEDERT